MPAGSEKGEKLKAELDDLLDEIDEVLETNAEDFVRNLTSRRAASRGMADPSSVAPPWSRGLPPGPRPRCTRISSAS